MDYKGFGSIDSSVAIHDLTELLVQIKTHPVVMLGEYLHDKYCDLNSTYTSGKCTEGIDCDWEMWREDAEKLLDALGEFFPGEIPPPAKRSRKLQLEAQE